MLFAISADEKKPISDFPILAKHGKFFIQSDKFIALTQQGDIWLYDLKNGDAEKLDGFDKIFHKVDDIDLKNRQLLYQNWDLM